MITAAKLTPSTPAPMMTAPTRPPNSAWLLEEGRPTSQVSRFQMMAPIKPAKMNSGAMVTTCSLIKPPEMVFATSMDKNAPTRFSVPAAMTAVLGLSAPVAMDVAIALARIVETVREVKRQCGDDHQADDYQRCRIHYFRSPFENLIALLKHRAFEMLCPI